MVKHFPKISIVTPCLNGEQYFDATLASLFYQEYPNLEYVVVDGGSQDGSLSILEKYGNLVSSVIREPGLGLYESINRGFASCSGEIMGWINTDDILHPGSLFTLAEIFTQFSDVDWVTGVPVNMDAQGRVFESAHRSRWTKATLLRGESGSLQQESTFWTRKLWEKAGAQLDTTYRLAADYELWCRFFEHADPVSIRAYLGAFRRHGKNLSYKGKSDYSRELERIREQYSNGKDKGGLLDFLRRARRPKVRAIFYNFEEKRFKLRRIPLNSPVYG